MYKCYEITSCAFKMITRENFGLSFLSHIVHKVFYQILIYFLTFYHILLMLFVGGGGVHKRRQGQVG